MGEGRKLGFLEKAIRLIPGYKGYKSKEERRDNDQLFRMQLVERLEALRKRVYGFAADMKGPAALSAVGGLDRVHKKLEKAADEIRFADRGYRGWFDMHKVREEELDDLYAFDVALAEDVERIEEAVASLEAAAAAGTDLSGSIREMVGLLDDLSSKMNSRSQLMIDLEKNTPVD